MTGEKIDHNNDDDFWKRKIVKHWKAFVVFIIGCVLAAIGAVMVLFWYIENSPIGAMGTATIGEWTLAWIWEFFIFLILWELLIVGIPAGIAFGVGWYLWRRNMPEEEKAEFKGKWKGRGTAESGGFGFFMFIVYTIYMYFNGDLFTPFDTYPYSYWVYAWFHTLAWILIIIGIPAAIILPIVFFKVWHKKENETQTT
ncbi:MAG: hypothetical protein AC479_05220 [miscellaneous Crenarchaeota group-6 archaeon AD8-1]|nr:MAG: hypothetical protein AC479_05220 [miscellaneous Crenarchaeota group-6 archaeon AD8-1]